MTTFVGTILSQARVCVGELVGSSWLDQSFLLKVLPAVDPGTLRAIRGHGDLAVAFAQHQEVPGGLGTVEGHRVCVRPDLDDLLSQHRYTVVSQRDLIHLLHHDDVVVGVGHGFSTSPNHSQPEVSRVVEVPA